MFFLANLIDSGIKLPNVGDFLSLERKSNGIVARAQSGNIKMSRMVYPNGTIHETRTIRPNK